MHQQRLHTPPLPPPPTRPLVDACTASGYTPLHYAAWFNHAEVIKVRAGSCGEAVGKLWGSCAAAHRLVQPGRGHQGAGSCAASHRAAGLIAWRYIKFKAKMLPYCTAKMNCSGVA